MNDLETIVEGKTKLVVPKDSLSTAVPPRNPAFFNPNARLSRDFSILAYSAFVKDLDEKSIADALAGVGARAIRAIVEIPELDSVLLNDANSLAVDMARESSKLNSVESKCSFHVNEVCRFLSGYSTKGSRIGIVDLDPFGTPAPYVDCTLRAVTDGGLLSITATDTPVLCGIYPDVSRRRYYGYSMNVEYGNEIGLRLVLGLISMTASRLELGIRPLFVHSTRNYLRVYAKVNVGSKYAEDMPSKLGCIFHCLSCGHRSYQKEMQTSSICIKCGKKMKLAGPLWIDGIFDFQFINDMLESVRMCEVERRCSRLLGIARDEVNMPPTYFSIDKIAERLKATPPSISALIESVRSAGFMASRTSLKLNGLRTNADISEISDLFRTLVAQTN